MNDSMATENNRIWIDLDNSPHVPFFNPIIKELKNQGYNIKLTARDCFQVCGLADLFGFEYTRIGRHYGKNKILKIYGTLFRALQLVPEALKFRPAIAISHGSRSQLIASRIIKTPSMVIYDYEHTHSISILKPDFSVAPEIIVNSQNYKHRESALKYPGLKEDVYVAGFSPDQNIRFNLGLSENDIVVTIRPPATEAHYHNPEAETLFAEVVDFVGSLHDSRMVVLPRNEIKQNEFIRSKWPVWCKTEKIIIPKKVVNGLDLIWASDLVVSGGGTMNREAAALGVPVYSIFRGKIGAIDQELSDTGRLTLIEKVNDVRKKIKLVKREIPEQFIPGNRNALDQIVKIITDKANK